jgi:hypothetical protein
MIVKTKAARDITWAAIIIVCTIIAAHLWHERCTCPELDEVYWVAPPLDTLRAEKNFVMIRDANNNYWVWRPKKPSTSLRSDGIGR